MAASKQDVRVAFVGQIGDDPNGIQLQKGLIDTGIDTSLVKKIKEKKESSTLLKKLM